MELFEAVRILIIFALSFTAALFATPFVERLLHRFNIKKRNIRSAETAPVFYQFHKNKSETPTMGGVIIWGTVLGLAFLFLVLSKTIDGFFNYFNFVDRAQTYLPIAALLFTCLLYTSPSPRDLSTSRMPSSA